MGYNDKINQILLVIWLFKCCVLWPQQTVTGSCCIKLWTLVVAPVFLCLWRFLVTHCALRPPYPFGGVIFYYLMYRFQLLTLFLSSKKNTNQKKGEQLKSIHQIIKNDPPPC